MTITPDQIEQAERLDKEATQGPLKVVTGNTPLGDTGDFEGYAQIECVGHRESDPVVCEIWNPEDDDVALLEAFAFFRTFGPTAFRELRDWKAVEASLLAFAAHMGWNDTEPFVGSGPIEQRIPAALMAVSDLRAKLDAAKAALAKLTKEAYGEANRLANHGSNGLERMVGSNLYDAANEAAAALRALELISPHNQ